MQIGAYRRKNIRMKTPEKEEGGIPQFAGKYPSLPGSTPIGREVLQFDGKYVSLARRKQAQQEAQPRVHKMEQNNNQLCVGKLQPATRQ